MTFKLTKEINFINDLREIFTKEAAKAKVNSSGSLWGCNVIIEDTEEVYIEHMGQENLVCKIEFLWEENYTYKTPLVLFQLYKNNANEEHLQIYYELFDSILGHVEKYCNDNNLIFNPFKEHHHITYNKKIENENPKVISIQTKIPIAFP